jgi:hypothetical protein
MRVIRKVNETENNSQLGVGCVVGGYWTAGTIVGGFGGFRR